MTRGSSLYPPNLAVGEVVAVYDDSGGMSRHAIIRPTEDLSKLTHVLVITGFEGRIE